MAFVLSFFRGRDHARQDWQSAASISPEPSRPSSPPPKQSESWATLDDEQKWKRSMARWNARIDPNNTEYLRVLTDYQDALKKDSVHNVLAENFSHHEIRKFESGYVDKKRLKVIYDQQKIDAAAYRDKLAQLPWRDYDADTKASLAFKLTMMHFGIPVEPMRFTDPLNLSGPLGNLGLTSAFEDDDDDDDVDENLTFVPEELRPLRFLNSYDRRGFGKDNSHMNPDKTYELYYGIPMMVPTQQLERIVSLRGGGDDSDDQPSVMGADEDAEMENNTINEDNTMSLDTNDKATRSSLSDNLVSLRGGGGDADTPRPYPGGPPSECPVQTLRNRAQRTTGREIPRPKPPYRVGLGASSSRASGVMRGGRPRPRVRLSDDGFPMRGERLYDVAKGKSFREWSYSRPMSINMEGQYPTIPINAPPVETILKTPGYNGFASDSVPVMSTQVMTPSEQRHLQETLFKMRSIALNRAQPCPYDSCNAYFPVDSTGTKAFRQHLKETHMGTNCPFCTEPLFSYWSPKQIKDHFILKHADYFSRKGDLKQDARISWPSLSLTHRREEQWSFCARCGRNHNLLINKADRTCHDNQCYPGVDPGEVDCQYCVYCGMRQSKELVANANGELVDVNHVCTITPEEAATNCFCTACALPVHDFSRVYAQKHLAHCKGSAEARTNWCPWCGINLKIRSNQVIFKHLDDCALKPIAGENPIDTSTGEPMESPRDNPNLLRQTLHFNRDPDQDFVLVPRRCPIDRCPEQNLDYLDKQELFDHFHGGHSVETSQMRYCPFCDLDFSRRQFTDRSQKVAHLEDHIAERRLRIILDNLIAVSTADFNSPAVQGALEQSSFDESVPLRRILALEQEQAAQEALIVFKDGKISQLEADLRQLSDYASPSPVLVTSAQRTSQAPPQATAVPTRVTPPQQEPQQLPTPGMTGGSGSGKSGKRPASARDDEDSDEYIHIGTDSDTGDSQPGSSRSAKRPRQDAAGFGSEESSGSDEYDKIEHPVAMGSRKQQKAAAASSSSSQVQTEGRRASPASPPASSPAPSTTPGRWGGVMVESGDVTVGAPPAEASRGRATQSRATGRQKAQGQTASQPGSSSGGKPRSRASTTRRGGSSRGRAGARTSPSPRTGTRSGGAKTQTSPSTRAAARAKDQQATVQSEDEEET